MDYILQKILAGLSVLTMFIQGTLATTTVNSVNYIATPTSSNIVATTTWDEISVINKEDVQKPKPIVKQEILTKKQSTIVLPTTKTCLSGDIVSINDYCRKTCPDGEIILENLSCKEIKQTTQNIQQVQYQNNSTIQDQNQLLQTILNTVQQTKNDNNNRIINQINQLVEQKNSIIIQFNSDKAAEESNPIPIEFINGRVNKLYTEAMTKINSLDLQIQQLQAQWQY